jgi:hypothetical protein
VEENRASTFGDVRPEGEAVSLRFSRTLSEAFSDERAYFMWDKRGKPVIFLKRRSWLERLWSIFK